MRAIFALLLASCAGTGVKDVLAPDELTIGHGMGSHDGELQTDRPGMDYAGDSETTYAALTWHIPPFEDRGLTQDERRAIREANLEKERALDGEGGTSFTAKVRESGELPPFWLPIGMFGILLMGFLGFWVANRRRKIWR